MHASIAYRLQGVSGCLVHHSLHGPRAGPSAPIPPPGPPMCPRPRRWRPRAGGGEVFGAGCAVPSRFCLVHPHEPAPAVSCGLCLGPHAPSHRWGSGARPVRPPGLRGRWASGPGGGPRRSGLPRVKAGAAWSLVGSRFQRSAPRRRSGSSVGLVVATANRGWRTLHAREGLLERAGELLHPLRTQEIHVL